MSCTGGKIPRALIALLSALSLSVSASATTLRIVTYNINADTDADPTGIPSAADVQTVANAIAAQSLAGNSQPIDVLALQELYYSNPQPSITMQAVVTDLNNIYGAGTYAYDPFVGYTDGNNTGNGPNGLIYNTKTVVDLGAVGVIDPSKINGSGAPRQPIRYELRPQGYGAGADFYIYDDHYLANESKSKASRRTVEADAVRADADSLGANAHIIWAGDFNLAGSTSSPSSTGSAEQMYQDLIAPQGAKLANGVTAGPEPAHDPLSTTFLNDTNNPTDIELYTESATDLTARFDFQLVSGPMLNQPGVQLVPNTQIAFGNSYYAGNPPTLHTTMTYGGAVTDSTNTGPGLSMAVRTALTTLTDHLPVVADYSVVGVPHLEIGDANGDGVVNSLDYNALVYGELHHLYGWSNGDFNQDGVINGDDYALYSLGIALYHASTETVPEPTTATCLLLLLAFPPRNRRQA